MHFIHDIFQILSFKWLSFQHLSFIGFVTKGIFFNKSIWTQKLCPWMVDYSGYAMHFWLFQCRHCGMMYSLVNLSCIVGLLSFLNQKLIPERYLVSILIMWFSKMLHFSLFLISISNFLIRIMEIRIFVCMCILHISGVQGCEFSKHL